MDVPTSADVRSWTPTSIDWSTYGYEEASPDPLDEQVAQAAASLYSFVGVSFADVPAELAPLFRRAMFGLTLLQVLQTSEDYMETIADFDLIQSLSVGSYSETRRSADDALKARALVAWPWLNGLLWQLMSPDKYDWWMAFFTGKQAPAYGTTEVEWMATSEDFYSGMEYW